jgi:hypothetical protein
MIGIDTKFIVAPSGGYNGGRAPPALAAVIPAAGSYS